MQVKGIFLLAFLDGKSLKCTSCPSYSLFNVVCFKAQHFCEALLRLEIIGYFFAVDY